MSIPRVKPLCNIPVRFRKATRSRIAGESSQEQLADQSFEATGEIDLCWSGFHPPPDDLSAVIDAKRYESVPCPRISRSRSSSDWSSLRDETG